MKKSLKERVEDKLNGEYTIIEFTNGKSKLVVKDKEGFLYSWKKVYSFLNVKGVTTQALVDKKEYVKFKIKQVWGEEYFLEDFKDFTNNIIVKDEDGFMFNTKYFDFIERKCKPSIQTCLTPYEFFVHKARIKHSDKYEYPTFSYKKGGVNKIDIICKYHGVFKQTPEAHLYPYGCPKCNRDISTTKNYIKKYKDSIINLYVVEGVYKETPFVKIGVTKRSIKERFSSYRDFKIKPIKIFKLPCEKAVEIETFIKINNYDKIATIFENESENLFYKTECFVYEFKDELINTINKKIKDVC